MSSVFEGLPQDPGVFSAPVAPRRSWPKIVAAFAAGIACTLLVGVLVSMPHKGGPSPQSKLSQRVSTKAPSAPAGPTAPSEAHVSSPVQMPPSTQPASPPEGAVAEAPVANSASAAPDTDDSGSRQSAALNCERQTWPYVDHGCAGGDVNAQDKRSVRVITTDRSAPATVITTPPTRAARTTDGMAPPPASTINRTTDGSTGSMGVASPEQMPASQLQRPDSNIAATQTDVPLPRPKPDELARAAALPADGTDVQQAAATTSPATSEPRSPRRSAERRQTRRSVAERDPTARDPGSETRRTREDVREAPEEEGRAVRSRATQQETTRVVRPRAAPTEDEDGYTLVRSSRTRDSRRVTVQQQPVEEAGGAVAREERPRSFFPFFFNPAAPGD